MKIFDSRRRYPGRCNTRRACTPGRPFAVAWTLLASLSLLAGCASLSDKRLDQVDRRDAVLTTDVKGALIGSPEVSAASIRVELEDGALVLTGFVDDEGERDAAGRVARREAPDHPIDNRLEVR